MERRAVALAALGHSSVEITGKLAEEKHALPTAGLGPIWTGAATKLGAERSRPQGRQPELVFRARVHAILDAPDPEDAGWLPPDVLDFIQALARGRTLKQYALDDLRVQVWEVDQIAKQTRKLLGGAPTQASIVYRALPQLLRTVQPPVEDVGTDLVPVSRPSPIVVTLQTELPGDISAVRAARWWTRAIFPALRWAGPIVQAAEVVARLVDNAVRHGMPDHVETQTLLLRTAVNAAGDLIIDVSDLDPSFHDFDAAARGERGRGLSHLANLGARVTWFLHHDGPGKTVRALLPPGEVDL
ncbi:ATP-binding protein [Streptomyces viridochromogenes]|uniref:ATP-binding protein n=1 Tax=Streptomyces viridochromogenes TaxID=1938 RepID=UPI00069F46B9|nr:ATP-binding protein [Streptomyces viridochromogenes]